MPRKKRTKTTPYEELTQEQKWDVVKCMQNLRKDLTAKKMEVSCSTIDKICDELFNKNKNLNYEKF
jgi:hypothetical protein